MKRTLPDIDDLKEEKEKVFDTNSPKNIRSKSAVRRMKLFESALTLTESSGEIKIPCPYAALLNIGNVPPISVSVISSQSKLTFKSDAPASFGDVEDIFTDISEKSEGKATMFVRRKFMKGNYQMHIFKTSSTSKHGKEGTLYSAILCRDDVEPRKIHSLLIDSNYGEKFRDENFINRYDWKHFRNWGNYAVDRSEDEEGSFDEMCYSSSCCSSDDSDESSDENMTENEVDEIVNVFCGRAKNWRYWRRFSNRLKCSLAIEPEPKRRKLEETDEIRGSQKNCWRYWQAFCDEDRQEVSFSQAPNKCKKLQAAKQNFVKKPLEDLTEDEMKSALKETLFQYFDDKELVTECTIFIDSSKIREVGGCRFTIEKENEWVYCLRSDGGGSVMEGNNGEPLGFILKNERSPESDISLITGDWHYGCVFEDKKSRECFAFVFGDSYYWHHSSRDWNDKPRFDVSETNYTYNVDLFLIDTPTNPT